ncbi:MAG: nucleotidyltransferase family protein [Thermoguttaceae bacterium]|jgi:molybdenum cofactor cytidylyltransferase
MIIAVVPAAGQSRRMGLQKQLLPFAGTTVIGHIVDELCRSRVDEVRVVVGHRADRLRQALEGRSVRIVANPDYERTDMLASIRCGLAAVPAACRAVLVALGDQPAITAELIDAMIDCFRSSGRGIVVPVYAGRRGHPLLLDGRYRGEILTGCDQAGLRGLPAAHAGDVFDLPVSSGAVLSDMDYPEDYQRELTRLGQLQEP